MLIPLQTFMALNQLKQAQQAQQQVQLAAALASAGGSGASSSGGTSTAATNQQQGGDKEVHQVDGFPPVLLATSQSTSRRSDYEARNLDDSLIDIASSNEVVMTSEQTFSSKVLTGDVGQLIPKPSSSSQSQSTRADSLHVGVAKSHSHVKKRAQPTSAAEFIVQLDGPVPPTRGQSSKMIVQVDGGRDNGSSSEDDSDAEEDSSEVRLGIMIIVVHLISYPHPPHTAIESLGVIVID